MPKATQEPTTLDRRRALFGVSTALAAMTLTAAAAPADPDDELMRLCGEFERLEKVALVACDIVPGAPGYDAAMFEQDRALSLQCEVIGRMFGVPPSTPQGQRRLAEAIVHYAALDFEVDDLDDNGGDRMVRVLIRGLTGRC